MKCPHCGTDNEAGFRFCVKCGTNLEDPQELNIEQLDMGGYHSEEDSSSGGFTLGSGTFTISDSPSFDNSSDLYTADELNDSDEEFDFSSFDEPFIPKLDTGRVALPEQSTTVRQAQMNNAFGGMQGIMLQPQPGMQGIPQPAAMQGIAPQGGMQGIPQPAAMQSAAPQGGIQGIPQPAAMQGIAPQGGMQGIPAQGVPQQNGMPVYGQPVMYAQPQIIGYDQNGNPVYGQPVMYAQPQIIGYDQSGMPVYGQPVMYSQPQIIGYDQSGMPVYGQPVMYNQPQSGDPMNPQAFQMPGMAAMPQMTGMPAMPQAAVPPPAEDKEKVEVPDDFWEFFDGGKATEHAKVEAENDFFGKRGDEIDNMKRFQKKDAYMNDTPIVDGSALLKKNEPAKFNKFYMKAADIANADDLEANTSPDSRDYMGVTRKVDADKLKAHEESRPWNIMSKTEQANADELEAHTEKKRGSMMAQADRAVEAMPKKPKTYNDEIDAIELPEGMKSKKKKTVSDTPEIPGLPEFYK
ncbi:MAG: zinc-ribbon domain-containing protein [Ruminococcus sp.]|nr:zinc-ribbon domain-containing protein [Ruminococcus sp.]